MKQITYTFSTRVDTCVRDWSGWLCPGTHDSLQGHAIPRLFGYETAKPLLMSRLMSMSASDLIAVLKDLQTLLQSSDSSSAL